MDEQSLFRVVFAVLFVSLFGVVGTYRRRAQAGRRIDSSKEGLSVFLALRIGGLFLWGYCFVYIFRPQIVDWSFVQLPPGLRWLGAVLVGALVPFVVSAQRALGSNVSPTVMTHEDHELVTSGPYRWIRNPLYAAGGLIFTGLGLVAGSWFLIAGAVLAVLLVRLRLPVEEAELEARFGDEYRRYTQRAGRFWPRWNRPGTDV